MLVLTNTDEEKVIRAIREVPENMRESLLKKLLRIAISAQLNDIDSSTKANKITMEEIVKETRIVRKKRHEKN
ncbi:hypothetical protein DN068_18345 [Taibaiella soli]|uniref:Uncharacterized protein n=1 Tax=Taibaiella soli TaxID=1649169 RepID=A0A2W2B4V9_9BACT|nr:hypothetical protein DN068_18345 [Taibaiella soli]